MTDRDELEEKLLPEDFRAIQVLMSDRVGIALGDNKQYLVVNRLTPIMRAFKFESLHAMIQTLRSGANSSLWDEVVDVLAVHETSFFRDEAPFRQLRQEILPAICRDAEQSGRVIRIWSAGCSTGQEAYSLAMLLTEIAPQLVSRVNILGSDVSNHVLESAEKARFRRFEVARGLSETRLRHFFRPDGDSWQAIDALRGMVSWRKFSLSGHWPLLPTFDLILLRNVMVYFDLPLRQALIQKVHRQLHPGGRLIIGSAESLMAIEHSFRQQSSHGATHYVAK